MSEQNLNQYEPGNGNNSGQGDPGNKGNEGRNGSGGSGKDPKRQSIVLFLIAALVTLLLMSSFMKMMSGETQKEISYNEFIQMLEDNKVESVTISTDRVNIKPKEEEKANKLLYLYGSPSAVTYYTGKIEDDDTLTQRLLKYDVPVKGEVADSSSVIISFLLTYVVPILLMWVLLSFLFRKMSKGGGPMGVGKSTAKVYVQKETGITTVFVTHDQEEAMSISDRIVVMKEGVVQQTGRPQEVYENPVNLFVARFLGTPQINLFEGRVEKGQLLIGEEAVLSVRGVEDQPLTVGIRPEGFLLREDGPLSLDLVRVEVMGRDISVVSTSEVSINPTVRSIIDAEMRLKVKEEKVHFALRPSKVLLFHKETEERIYPEEAE